jgi:hypothetical protein
MSVLYIGGGWGYGCPFFPNAPFQECQKMRPVLWKFKLLTLNRVKQFFTPCQVSTIFHAVQTPDYPLIKRQQIQLQTKVFCVGKSCELTVEPMVS